MTYSIKVKVRFFSYCVRIIGIFCAIFFGNIEVYYFKWLCRINRNESGNIFLRGKNVSKFCYVGGIVVRSL